MMPLAALLLAALAAPVPVPAPAPTMPVEAPAGQSELFVREALRICVDTAAEPAPIRRLAAEEKWRAVDPNLIPLNVSMIREDKEKRKETHKRASAWVMEKDGIQFAVGLFDIPGEPRMKQCELVAFDLDAASVDRAIRADPRFRSSSPRNASVTFYSAEGLSVTYLAGDVASKALHAVMVN